MKKKSDENLLLERVSSGDRDAFRSFFDAYRQRVYAYAFRILRSKEMAEDVVQDIFLKLWLNRDSLAEVESAEAYLRIITRNHTLKLLRRLALQPQSFQTAPELKNDLHNETEELIEYRDSKRMLESAVERLPPRQQIAYKLCYDEGFKYEEAAVKLGISTLTVKTHMQHALRFIRHFLKKSAGMGL